MGQYAIVFFLSLIFAIIIGQPIIKKLKRMKFGQNVAEYGLEKHKKKQGTPTMGGVIILIPLVVVSSIFLHKSAHGRILIIGTLLFGLIGFIDDYIMIKKKRSEGLKPWAKLLLNLLFGVGMGYIFNVFFNNKPTIHIPIINEYFSLSPILYIIFIVIFYASVTNTVNLSDGVDGLSSSIASVIMIFYIVYALTKNIVSGGEYQIAEFAIILLGSTLGYLLYNWHPARVFMGDVGSFALGGALATLAILTHTEILFILIGLIYVIEALSDIIQITSIVKFKKKIFLMAPIHHHFEKKGWSEEKVVGSFSLFTLICCVIAYFIG